MKLTKKQRGSYSSSTFGLPSLRKFPMPDRNHAGIAKSYASRMHARGQLSSSQFSQINRKADGILKKGLRA